MNQRTREILLHVLGCLCFLALPVISSPDFSFNFSFVSIRPFQREFLFYFLMLLFFYANYYVLVPRIYFRRQFGLFVAVVLVSYIVVSLLPEWLFPFGPGPGPQVHGPGAPPPPMGGPPPPGRPPFENVFIREIRHTLFQFTAVFILSLMLRINTRWKQTEQEKVKAELSYMRAQMNPHFLFNTLNSIYSLALDRSENTAPAMVKLSGIMRYVLSEADRDRVPLEKELAYISDFIDLQKLRLGDTVKVSVKVSGESKGKEIAPMILIAFVENAFKHGVNPEEDGSISVKVDITERYLALEVSNNKVHVDGEGKGDGGKGLATTRRRLDLLYPGKHQLAISDEMDKFTVSLGIQL
jgi:hypothetical protein